jgi:hypothetical protein
MSRKSDASDKSLSYPDPASLGGRRDRERAGQERFGPFFPFVLKKYLFSEIIWNLIFQKWGF